MKISEQTFEALETLQEAFGVVEDIRHLDETISPSRFKLRQVISVEGVEISSPEGYASEDVLAYGKTYGGWWLLEAWCDTTGWDCQAGGSIRLADSLEVLVRFGMSQTTRETFGLSLEEDEDEGS